MSEIAYGKPTWMKTVEEFNINTQHFLEYVESLETRLESTEKAIAELILTLDSKNLKLKGK